MADLNWLPRESGIKDHFLWGEEHFSNEAPGVMYEKKPILDPKGNVVEAQNRRIKADIKIEKRERSRRKAT